MKNINLLYHIISYNKKKNRLKNEIQSNPKNHRKND